ncbi:MAG TPA: hypothetical protein VFC78_06240 [Tepidisphaeraceae bacterium]|nr:hypothetical protein [Tepidisphaeraceae bacterium]
MNNEKLDTTDPATNDVAQHDHTNPDLITGAPGSHPIGTGIGAAAVGVGGTAAGIYIGAAIGTVSTGPLAPIGGAIGAIIGGIAGAWAGHSMAEHIDPTVEDAYWRENHKTRPYYQQGTDYDQYAPAYRYGYEAHAKHADKSFDQVESVLGSGWDNVKSESTLSWDKARQATRDAWDRADSLARRTAGTMDKTSSPPPLGTCIPRDPARPNRMTNPDAVSTTTAGKANDFSRDTDNADPDRMSNDATTRRTDRADARAGPAGL